MKIENDPTHRNKIHVGRSAYTAAEMADKALKKLDELKVWWQKAIAFYAKHQTILDGLYWEACPFGERIEINCEDYYIGDRKPADIARQFGGKWVSKRNDHSSERDFYRDWESEIDGVKVRLKKAVNLKPIEAHEEMEVSL